MEEALALFRNMRVGWAIADSLTTLGGIASDQGDHSRAATLLEEGLALAHQVRNKRGVAMALEELGAVVCAQAQPERAARLFGAAEAQRDAIGAPLAPVDQARYDGRVADTRIHLGERACARRGRWAGRWLPNRPLLTRCRSSSRHLRRIGRGHGGRLLAGTCPGVG